MKTTHYLLIVILISLSNISSGQTITPDAIVKIEMHLSAFGVESDDFPSIDGEIDFLKQSSHFRKWFYNPAYKDSTYSLTKEEMQKILTLLTTSHMEELKKEYRKTATDQSSTKMLIYTKNKFFTFNDYGLIGSHPLGEIYKIVYKL